MLWLVGLAFLAAAFAVSALGVRARRRNDRWRSGTLTALSLAGMGAGLMFALGFHNPDVSAGAFAVGIFLATFALGLVPVLCFYSLGYWLNDGLVVGIATLVLAIPLGLYTGFVAFVAGMLSACPPGCLA